MSLTFENQNLLFSLNLKFILEQMFVPHLKDFPLDVHEISHSQERNTPTDNQDVLKVIKFLLMG